MTTETTETTEITETDPEWFGFADFDASEFPIQEESEVCEDLPFDLPPDHPDEVKRMKQEAKWREMMADPNYVPQTIVKFKKPKD